MMISEAPDSIPPLLRVLKADSDGFVREEAINILYAIDNHKMRLRATPVGLEAIAAIHEGLQRGGLKPVYAQPAARDRLRMSFTASTLHDQVDLGEARVGRFWLECSMSCTQPTWRIGTPGPLGQTITQATPIVRQFITYLTDTDPSFPGWEYTYVGDPGDEVLNPRFRQKMARYYDEWKRFQIATKSVPKD
jgi:hypothetical protein